MFPLRKTWSIALNDYRNKFVKYNLHIRSELIQYLDRFKSLPAELKEEMLGWPTVRKSPYSRSFYSSNQKSWEFTPEGCRRISDHWNFRSKRSRTPLDLHCTTNQEVKNGTHWTLAEYREGIWKIVSTFRISKTKRS